MPLNVVPPPVQPPEITVPDETMVTQLQSEGYTVTPPGPPAGKPVAYWWNNSPMSCPIAQKGVLDYAYGTASNTYSQSAAQAYTNKGWALMLKVGALNPGEPTAIGNELVSGGQASAIIVPMWEYNQGVKGWFPNWNQLAFTTPAAYIARFNAIVAEFKKVNGQKFTFGVNPNVNQVNNQAPGRNQLDTMPPAQSNLVLLLDGYDNPKGSGTANVAAQSQPFVAQAQAQGTPYWGYAEYGPNGWDDPAYITNHATYAQQTGAKIQCLFANTGNPDSMLNQFPNMEAAYKTNFG